MILTGPVLAAVLFGALLHASWNAMVKASADPALESALFNLGGSLIAIPLMLWTGLPAPAAWPYLAVSITVHVGYHFALSAAYRHGDLGLTYPLMRGSAPVLVALASALFVGETLSPVAWAGVLAVSAGVATLGLAGRGRKPPRAIAIALGNAVIIATYTVIDGLGVRISGNALQYVLGFFALDGWLFGALVLRERGWATGWAYARTRAPFALVGAVASIGSYGIALWAMTRAPVAAVAALRETSVLFAAVIGTSLLKEAFTARRALGTLAILAGVMALRLG
jgi:phosphonate utilization associated putative membrane protein